MLRFLSMKRGIWLGLISVLLFVLFRTFPGVAENIYGQIFYPSLQFLRSSVSYLIPISLFYVVILLFLGYLLRQLYKLIKRKPSWSHFFHKLFGILGYLVFLFYFTWGFNYARPGITEKLELELSQPDSIYVMQEFERTVKALNKARSEITQKDTLEWYGIDRDKYADQVDPEVQGFLRDAGYPSAFPTFVEPIVPKGILLRFKTAGFYFPYSGEGYVDAGVPDISYPEIYAHELSHVYGVTNEGEANFVAYRSCMKSLNPFIKYSALHSYLFHAARAAKSFNVTEYQNIRSGLDSLVLQDIKSASKALNNYPDIMPDLRDRIFDTYLKTQGVSDGLKSYGQLYLLEHAWKTKNDK